MPNQAPEETKKHKKRRGLKLIALTAGLVIVGGVAFAYWTQGGSGSGSASTGDINAVSVVQTSTVSGLAPGVAPQTLSGNFNNPNDGPVYVSTVVVEISGVDSAGGNCDASDYTLTGASMNVGAEIEPGNGKGSWGGATIAFNNKPSVNQDDCKGATVHLTYTAN